MSIVKSIEKSGLMIKGVTKRLENEAKKKKKGGVLSVLLGTLGANVL